MQIKVKFMTMVKIDRLALDTEANVVLANGEQVNVDAKDVAKQILSIVKSWQPVMINPSVLDGLRYDVEIEKEGQVITYHGANKFPDNFNDLVALLKNTGVIA